MTSLRPHRTAPRQRQGGAALMLAMVIVTLVATMAVSMVWQQWRAVQVEIAERARAQSGWILSGALDWAGLILKEDARPSTAQVDHLGEPWAVPLAEARLSTFLAVDESRADDAPDVFLSGAIADAQGRFNLRNLLEPSGQVSPPDVAALGRLCANLNLSPTIATALANGLKDASTLSGNSGTPADPPLLPKQIDQLGWLGVDPQALQRLAPYIVLLPSRSTLNINTASREVIAASVPGLTVSDAERLVQMRQRTPFRSAQDIQAQLPRVSPQDLQGLEVFSSYFEVRGRLRLGERVLEQRSLLARNSSTITVLSSERISSTDSANDSSR